MTRSLAPDLAALRPSLEAVLRTEDMPGIALATACLRVALEREPGTHVQYSNQGSGLLAVIVERQTGQDFAAALTHLVLDPLGIEG
jgi:CubicO group peptidase (beta-lactamase class C family)